MLNPTKPKAIFISPAANISDRLLIWLGDDHIPYVDIAVSLGMEFELKLFGAYNIYYF